MSEAPANFRNNPRLSGWVAFQSEGEVAIRSGKVEIGQGVTTAIAAIAARELGIDPSRIRMLAADTDASPDEGYTAGSFSIEHGGSAMRWACAQVRELFAEEAQKRLGGSVILRDGVFLREDGNVGVSYWQLAGAIDLSRSGLDLPAPEVVGGTVEQDALHRIDLEAKLTGPAFIQDMRLPGMLFGRVLRPAHPADSLESVDDQALAALPGIKSVVRDGGFFGVVASRDDEARAAIAAAMKTASWTRSRQLPRQTSPNSWIDALTPQSTTFIADEAPAPAAAASLTARYSRAYIAHAAVGPSCAVASWDGDQVTVWSHSQGIFPLRRTLARALRMDVDKVRVIHALGAGCYGHNGADDVALDAALLARAAGAPVMCLWSRADELSWSPFGAAMRTCIKATLDGNDNIASFKLDVFSPPHLARPGSGDGVNLLAAWSLKDPLQPAPLADSPRPYGGGDRNAVPLYRLGKRIITHHLLPQGPLRSSAMRALGAHCNVFAIESAMDELAAIAEADPVDFRLRHLDDARAKGVIRAAATRAGWTAHAPGGEGRGRGIGFSRYKNLGAWCAVVAEIDVTDRIELRRMVAAIDAGEVIHRDGILNQIEGGIIQAASWTLKEAVGWTDDGFAVRSWSDYPILRFAEIPPIEIEIVERPGDPSLGAGECVAGPVAAAIGNALAHALGIRVRDLPLTPERIAAAINSPSSTGDT